MSKRDKKMGLIKPKYQPVIEEYRIGRKKHKPTPIKSDHKHDWQYEIQECDWHCRVYKKTCSVCGVEKLWAKFEWGE